MAYTIAYLDKNGIGYADNYPWIVMPPYDTLARCQQSADKMIRAGYKDVTIFHATSSLSALLEQTDLAWDYVKRHQVRCAGARAELARAFDERTREAG